MSRSGEGGTERRRLDDSHGKSRGGRNASKSLQGIVLRTGTGTWRTVGLKPFSTAEFIS